MRLPFCFAALFRLKQTETEFLSKVLLTLITREATKGPDGIYSAALPLSEVYSILEHSSLPQFHSSHQFKVTRMFSSFPLM